MKNLFFLALGVIIIFSCSKEQEKFELFSAEAFAFSMDTGWELNASCRAKGFFQKEENNNFKVKLSFTVDLQTPAGELLQGVGEGLIDKIENERLSDLPIETQIQLDSTYKTGNYKIIFNVSDDLAGKSISIVKEFELTN